MPKPAADDFGSSSQDSGLYSLGSSQSGVIEVVDDLDWFAIDIDSSSVGSDVTLTIRSDFGRPDRRLDLAALLLAADGLTVLPVLVEEDQATGALTLTWTPQEAGRYFLQIGADPAATADSNKTGSYAISSTVGPGGGDPPPPAITYGLQLVDELSPSQLETGASFAFVVSRQASDPSALIAETLELALLAETAGLSESDFVQPFPQVVSFAPGESELTLTVDVLDDDTVESDESFRLDLRRSGLSVALSEVLTVENDDASSVNPLDDANQHRAWGQHNTGQIIGYYSDGSPAQGKVDADTDWYEAYLSSSDGVRIKVGVIDSGARVGHEDLGDIKGYDFIRGDSTPNDENGHGTHVQGTIAALDNSVGVVGYDPRADVYTYKAGDRRGSLPGSAILAALDRGISDGIQIYNCSYGSYTYSSVFYSAYQKVQNSGALVFAAAGNGDRNGRGYDSKLNPHYPSSYDLDGIVSVAASDFEDRLAGFSDYGDYVDLAAPGLNIYSTTNDGAYGFNSGTSMASPGAAGAASLLWSQNPGLTAAQVKRILMDSVDPISGLPVVSGGRLNVNNALAMASADYVGSFASLDGFSSFGASDGAVVAGSGGFVERAGGAVPSAARVARDEIVGNGVILALLNPRRLDALTRVREQRRQGVGPFAAIDQITTYKNLPGIVSFQVDKDLSVRRQLGLAAAFQNSALIDVAHADFNHFLI